MLTAVLTAFIVFSLIVANALPSFVGPVVKKLTGAGGDNGRSELKGSTLRLKLAILRGRRIAGKRAGDWLLVS